MLTPETEAKLAALNDKQRAFVLAFAVPSSPTRNHVTNSSLAAGYATKTAAEQGSRLLTENKIREAVLYVERDYREKREALALVDQGWLHKTLSGMAQSSIIDFIVVEGGHAKIRMGRGVTLDLQKLSEDHYASRRVDSIKLKENALGECEIEIKMTPIATILKMVGEHSAVGAWAEPMNVEERTGLADDIAAGRKRALEARANRGGLRLASGQ